MKIRGKQESRFLLEFNFRIKAQKEEENWERHWRNMVSTYFSAFYLLDNLYGFTGSDEALF